MDSSISAITFGVGLLLGAIVVYALYRNRSAGNAKHLLHVTGQRDDALDRAQKLEVGIATAKAEQEASAKQVEEIKDFKDRQDKQMSESFEALASKVLESNTKRLVERSNSERKSADEVAAAVFDARKKSLDDLAKPIETRLKEITKQAQEMEKTRQTAYGSLREQVNMLQQETGRLSNAFRRPHVRGNWGEMTLHRVVEVTGMQEHVDFGEQVTVRSDEDAQLRPDMVVRLPANRQIVVDAKVPFEAFRDAQNTDDEDARKSLLEDHARQFRTHVNSLGDKPYSASVDGAVDFVVMFVPSEALWSAALQQDEQLLERAAARSVFVATPTNLMALLRAIAYGWDQQELSRNAHEISVLGKELHDRVAKFGSHVIALGKTLSRSVKGYNDMVGSLERMVLPSVRRFSSLGVPTDKSIDEVSEIELTTKQINAPELIDVSSQEPESNNGSKALTESQQTEK